MMVESDLTSQADILLKSAGLSSDIVSIKPCAQGGNNRTYRLETSDGIFALKKYFRQPDDVRDRLAAEFSFLMYAKQVASEWVPAAFSQNKELGIALYEFIDGKSISPAELTQYDIEASSKFFCALNEVRFKSQAMNLALASESCFSIQSHLDLVNRRIHALQQSTSNVADDAVAIDTIRRLSASWEELVATVLLQAAREGIDIHAELPHEKRCISPSDFGFHNALRLSDGSVRFLDFEYAGWDDPAKMIGDFFSQLAVPVPAEYFELFVEQSFKSFTDSRNLAQRARLLRDVYRIKWCCIALNVFIPVNLARRQFANPNLNVAELKQAQLKKVNALLDPLSCT